MAQSSSKKKPVAAMIVMGIVSVALYATLLLKQDLINETFAKGGMYALLPIITAFVFSYFHGGFTGHFWTVLGVEAARKKREVK
jgi:F0F1-type ATP synthase assembly protein I